MVGFSRFFARQLHLCQIHPIDSFFAASHRRSRRLLFHDLYKPAHRLSYAGPPAGVRDLSLGEGTWNIYHTRHLQGPPRTRSAPPVFRLCRPRQHACICICRHTRAYTLQSWYQRTTPSSSSSSRLTIHRGVNHQRRAAPRKDGKPQTHRKPRSGPQMLHTPSRRLHQDLPRRPDKREQPALVLRLPLLPLSSPAWPAHTDADD
ncbi:hypothetical protein C8F04DRAFT_520934 [Mycena alexandri]|uniref:Uncharacterized protein n=1 Tax=Mycena alexandri TaxID=1745969 RepID=A0AAD6XAA4_9AGAR|nr:hypothetical protein C8F04DRAFT_520934 [Mycena alexandri]